MKKLNLVFILSLCLILFMPYTSYALTNVKGIDQLVIKGSQGITLNDEEIEVDVTTGKTTCNYELYNTLEQDVKVNVLYPVRYYTVNNVNETNISNFNAFVDNKLILCQQQDSSAYQIKFNYVFDVLIKAKSSSNVKVTYDVNWKVENDSSILVGCYRMQNTNLSGTINHSKITFDFGELSKYYVISPNDNSTYKKVETKYVWEANNYNPKEDLGLLMRPKLLSSKTINISYYGNREGLKNKRILIDVNSNYTKTDTEETAVFLASQYLKSKLEESGAEVAYSNEIEKFEKEIKKEANFDYVITLICKSSQDPNLIAKEIFVEPLKWGNEDKYLKSAQIATYIQNAGTSGIGEYFTALKSKYANSNVMRYTGSLDVASTKYNDVPRIIISIGYITDLTKCYETSEGIMEKIRLGLVLYEENETKENDSDVYIITKNNYKITNGKKNFIQKFFTRVSKFFKYNIVTIISSIMIGIGLAIVIVVLISSHYDKKIKISYDDIKKKEKELETKMSLIERERQESEKHKETLKEIIKERLRKTLSSNDKEDEKVSIQIKEEIKNEIMNNNLGKVVDVNNNDLISNDIPNESIKKENKFFDKMQKQFDKIKNKIEDAKMNKFSKTTKNEAKKYISKINSKGIGK